MNGSLAFVEDELAAAHREDTDRTPPILDARDLDDFRPVIVRLFHEVRISELVLGECLDVCDGFASEALCEKVDLIAFYVFDDKDVEALQEGKGCVIDCVAQNGFLDEQDVTAALFDFFAYVEQVCAPLLDDFVHLPVIVDDDRVVHLRYSSVFLPNR